MAQRCFARQMFFDISSLTGSSPGMVGAREIVAGWEQGLAPIQAVHHQAGNYRVQVDGDEADASCYGIASHYLPNPSGRNTRVFVGSHDIHLQRDGELRISMFRFTLK